MTPRTTVLITGGSGRVANLMVHQLRALYRIRRADRVPPGPGSDLADDEILSGDINDSGFLDEALAGVDAVIHLAANPSPGATWDQLARPNVHATVGLLEAVRAHGVPRVILASSIHAAGAYRRSPEHQVSPDLPANPCCLYGATKAFAEAVGRVYARPGRLSVICLRLGYVHATPDGAPQDWLSPPDLGLLFTRALLADVVYGIYFGISANIGLEWDLTNAERELAYRPVQANRGPSIGIDQPKPGSLDCR